MAGQGLGVIRHRAVGISRVRAYQPAVLGGLGWGSWLSTFAPDHAFTMAFVISPPIATPLESVLKMRGLGSAKMSHVVGSANRGLGPFEYGDRLHAPGQDSRG